MKRAPRRGCTILWALALIGVGAGGAGCSKKSSPSSEGDYKDIAKTFDESEPPPEQRKPIEGVQELEKLSDSDKQRFEKLVDKLPSPCGKSHSLRTSRNTDAECGRAKFAVDYVAALIDDGATDDEVREFYAARYKETPERRFKLDEGVPHVGPADARIVLVEFFDFGCPACAEFRGELKEAVEAYPTDVVLYFKQFPLAAHEHSKGAAQCALAAAKQGKYHEMHELLFSKQPAHTKDELTGYAKEMGLDMKKFEADYAAAEPQVESDKKEGEEAEVSGTPTLFINGHQFDGPSAAKYLKMWIDEELAVNR